MQKNVIFPYFSFDCFTIRMLAPDEASRAIDYYLENKEFLTPWEPEKPEGYYEIDYWVDKLSRNLEEFKYDKSMKLFIMTDESEVIGGINFTNFERGAFQNCRLGYSLGERFNKKGIMTNSLRIVLDYVFDELKLHRVEANYLPRNTGSARILERLGFKQIGKSERYLKINGEWQSHIHTSLIKEDWKS